jgi:solute carrier family 31 (copper transporter), member 1
MLAVMTMNVGYFVAVIAGVFLGTFILGDLATNNSLYEEHHC